jgi:hypothetical protein
MWGLIGLGYPKSCFFGCNTTAYSITSLAIGKLPPSLAVNFPHGKFKEDHDMTTPNESIAGTISNATQLATFENLGERP